MAGEKILIVDDNPTNLKLVAYLMRAKGYDVSTAIDADAAIADIRARRPALILMDVQLPGIDGLELTRRLKADPATRDIIIVAVTAYAMKGDQDKAVAAGCDDYVTKPIDTRALPTRSRGTSHARSMPRDPAQDHGRRRQRCHAPHGVQGAGTQRTSRARGADGKTARELMSREKPRVVLQDLMLPDADGFVLVGELRGLAQGSDVSILAFSGFVSELDEARVSTVGFDDIIAKPIAPSRLVPLIEAHLPQQVPVSGRFGAGRRVVLVDDDPIQLKLATFRCRGSGSRPRRCTTVCPRSRPRAASFRTC